MGEDVKLLAKGAEADLYLAEFSAIFFDSSEFGEIIVKKRIPKGYRTPELDLRLRRQRTISEARIIHDARAAGANVPIILGVWSDKCLLIMERIEGVRLKEYLDLEEGEKDKACRKAGSQLGILHEKGIVHGDPTTSNMILREGEVYLIDFGLAEYSDSIEKKAIDIHLLKTAMKSTHFRHFKTYYSAALDGYSVETEQADDVLERCRSIEKRGRYVER